MVHAQEDVEQGEHSSIDSEKTNLTVNMEISIFRKLGIDTPQDPARYTTPGIYQKMLYHTSRTADQLCS